MKADAPSRNAVEPTPHPHRRRNPLSGEWVLVSPQRTDRPWQGQVEPPPPEHLPKHDPDCYLCPGNARSGRGRNPEYEGTFVFPNDFPALLADGPGEYGSCRVVCYSPRHDLGLGELSQSAIERVIEVWTDQYAELGNDPHIGHVQIFENRGAAMGASNPHPHGQIWATEHIPTLVAREQESLLAEPTLLADYLAQEDERVVEENESFVALVPYWAVWPFETLVVPRRPVPSLLRFDDCERSDLAAVLRALVRRYDRLFDTRFPYSMGIHQAPTDGDPHDEWHLHLHFYPPLLRSASVRKFMVGYELLAEPQRDLTPEEAAERLRSV
ncbi:MAG TPA: UDP-glucose--hexose-1-phosphate uridylyltransferase [Gaiellaceae bacterium]|nr:UDP-glucose--hexose-1-phosphate uridylyltransferase [Gaiellaceae bacterium]